MTTSPVDNRHCDREHDCKGHMARTSDVVCLRKGCPRDTRDHGPAPADLSSGIELHSQRCDNHCPRKGCYFHPNMETKEHGLNHVITIPEFVRRFGCATYLCPHSAELSAADASVFPHCGNCAKHEDYSCKFGLAGMTTGFTKEIGCFNHPRSLEYMARDIIQSLEILKEEHRVNCPECSMSKQQREDHGVYLAYLRAIELLRGGK